MAFEYDFAISYASDTRPVAEDIATRLKQAGYARIFYDRREEHELTGRDGVLTLTDVYSRRSRLCILLLSNGYEASAWTKIERTAILDRERIDPTNFIIPVLVNGDAPAWLGGNRLWFNLQQRGVDDLMALLVARAGEPGAARAQPEILWQTRIGVGTWKNEPVPHGDYVYAASAGDAWNAPDDHDGVYCLRRTDGVVQWHTQTDADANSLTLDDGVLYVGTDAGTVYALDSATGAEIWKSATGNGPILARPFVVGDRVIVFTAGGNITVLDKPNGGYANGAFVWSVRGGVVADPVAHGDAVYVVSRAGVIFELPLTDPIPSTDDRPQNFPQRSLTMMTWSQFELDGRAPCEFHGTPAVLDDVLLLPYVRDTSYPGVPIAAIERRRLLERFTIAEPEDPADFGNVRARPAICGGLAIAPVAYGNEIVAFDRTGRIRWIQHCGTPYFPQYGSPATYGADVLVPRFDGYLHAVRGSNGDRRWAMFLGGGDGNGEVISGDALDPGELPGPEWDNTSCSPLNAPLAIAADVAFVHAANGVLYAVGLPAIEDV